MEREKEGNVTASWASISVDMEDVAWVVYIVMEEIMIEKRSIIPFLLFFSDGREKMTR